MVNEPSHTRGRSIFNKARRRLDEVLALAGFGTALVGSVPTPNAFRSEHDFSAWMALLAGQNSSGVRG